MSEHRFDSIWDAIESAPGEAENMKLRSELMIALKSHIEAKGWTQTEAAKRMGVTQPRVSDLMRGKVQVFALDALVNAASAAGLSVKLDVRAVA